MQYQVMTAGDCAELIVLVQKMIDQRWRPQGGVAVSTTEERDGYGNTHRYTWFHQALIQEPRTGEVW